MTHARCRGSTFCLDSPIRRLDSHFPFHCQLFPSPQVPPVFRSALSEGGGGGVGDNKGKQMNKGEKKA